CAEPDRIQEIYYEGFNVYKAEKKITDGIDSVKRYKLHIYSECVNTIKEIQAYKYKEDKDGNTLEIPVEYNDHAMDAIRYAIHTGIGKRTATDITTVRW
nr:terminase large subunit [Thermotogota bacterium]